MLIALIIASAGVIVLLLATIEAHNELRDVRRNHFDLCAKMADLQAENARLRHALGEATTDIRQWIQLGENHRKALGEQATYEPYCPTEMGIDSSYRVLRVCAKALKPE